MIEIYEDYWELYEKLHGTAKFCIPTNGCVKRNGRAVMGRGIAYQALKRFPGIAEDLGKRIERHGNIVQPFSSDGGYFVAFPVKPARIEADPDKLLWRHKNEKGKTLPGWMARADPNLIAYSLGQLMSLQSMFGGSVYLPKPGCGNGELKWEKDVKPICEFVDGDWLKIVDKPKNDPSRRKQWVSGRKLPLGRRL